SHEFVVISRDVDDAGTLAGLAQDFLDDVVVLLRPINSATQRPDINEIPHYVERVEIVLAKKIEQRCGIAAPLAQIGVGDPASTITPRQWQLLSRFPE